MAGRNRIADQLAGKGTKSKGKGKVDDAEDDDIDVTEDDDDDDDVTEDDDDDQDDDDADDDADDDEKLKPAGIKALRDERKKRRTAERELAALKARQPKGKSKKDDDGEDDDDSGPTAREIAAENRLKTAGLRAALTDAGVSTKNARLLIGQVKLDDVELDDDDDIEDVDEFIDELKAEFPDLFGKGKADDDDERPRRRRVPGAGDGARRGREPVKKSSTDRLVAGLLGKG